MITITIGDFGASPIQPSSFFLQPFSLVPEGRVELPTKSL